MFRLFQRIPRGLEPVAEIFKEHVESEGTKLVKEVTEAAESKKDAGGANVVGVWDAGGANGVGVWTQVARMGWECGLLSSS